MIAALPNWLEQFLGVKSAETGEGTTWALETSWSWAPWMTLLFVVCAVAFVVVVYTSDLGPGRRLLKVLLIGARLTLIGLLLLMIAEVVLSLKRTGLPYVVVMVDDSASMGIADRYTNEKLRAVLQRQLAAAGLETTTRLNLAKAVLLKDKAELLHRIERDYKLKVYVTDASARAQAGTVDEVAAALRKLEPTGESTQLGSALRAVLNDLRGNPPAAIIVLTDGITTEGESLAEAAGYARRKGVPLYAVALGDEQRVRDVELSDLLVDEVVFVDDIVNFECTLVATGYEGRTIEVVLHDKNSPATLAKVSVPIKSDGQPQKVQLPHRPTTIGEFEYVVEVAPQNEEVETDNNRLSRVVSVRKEQIRVLLVQAYPNFEFRYLKNMLERDGTIEINAVLQDADPQYADSDKGAVRTFPLSREELFAYDVLIFGDVNPGFLSTSAMDHVADFVQQKGGGLILVAGELFTPQSLRGTRLESLVPVEFKSLHPTAPGQLIVDGFVVEPTELGLSTPAMQLGDSAAETREIWRHLPPLYWFFEAPQLRPAARVLAEHPTHLGADGHKLPLVVLQYAGAGKVLFHAINETWRWRYRVGDVYFARYWIQSIRYLSRSKLLGKDRSAELTVDRREYRRGESVRLRVRFIDERIAPAADDGVTVVVEQDGREKRNVTLQRAAASQGIFEGVFPQPAEGSYHAWVVAPVLEGRAPAADFLVVAPPGEFARVEMNKADLERATQETKGRLYTPETAERLLQDLPAGHQVPIESLPSLPLWNQWPLLALFLALLIGEWILRKRLGLV